MQHSNVEISQAKLLRLPQVLEIIPVSKSTWWEGVKSGRFPASIKLGGRITVWRSSDIQKYIDEVMPTT